jgi:hypothetical protein
MNRVIRTITAASKMAGSTNAEPVLATNATTTYHRAEVEGVNIYREAGPKAAPTIVLVDLRIRKVSFECIASRSARIAACP